MNMDHFNLVQNVQQNMVRMRGLGDRFNPKGKFKVRHTRKGILIAEHEFHNDIVNQGKNNIFDVYFNSASQITAWYIGLIDNTGFSALAATDVMNSHAGWNELVAYSQANRVTWGSGAASSQSVTNASPATFTMTATNTVYGIFITSSNNKGGTTGTLWSTGGFAAAVPVVNGDQLNVTYTLNA